MHAVERYRERVRPQLDRAQANTELKRLLPHATLLDHAPVWVLEGPTSEVGDVWLEIADGIGFPLRAHGTKLSALTCLVRCRRQTGLPAKVRRRRERAAARASEFVIFEDAA
jgi:hypothetical protein